MPTRRARSISTMLGAAAEEAPPEAVEAPQAAEGVTDEDAAFNFGVAAETIKASKSKSWLKRERARQAKRRKVEEAAQLTAPCNTSESNYLGDQTV